MQLLFCFRADSGTTVTVAEGRKAPEWERMNENYRVGDIGIEYALVRVTNIGRTPVSVEYITLDTGRYRRFGRGRYSVTPMQFKDPDDKSWVDVDLGQPQRLDPGANISAALHLWPTLADDMEPSACAGNGIRPSVAAKARMTAKMYRFIVARTSALQTVSTGVWWLRRRRSEHPDSTHLTRRRG